MIGINLNNRDRTFITEWEQSTQNKSTITVPSKISNEVLKRTIKKNKNTVTTITFDTNNQITAILDDTFTDCIKLTTIIIPENVTSIGKNAFNNCTSLTKINIPQKVSSIGENAFNMCNKLKSIKLFNVNFIGKNAFNNCSELKNILFNNDISKITIEDGAFNNINQSVDLYTFILNSAVSSLFSSKTNITNINYIIFTAPGSSEIQSTIPFDTFNLNEIKEIATGGSHVLALTIEGTIIQWGVNKNNQELNNSILNDKKFNKIAAGGMHSLAITTDGNIIQWGDNSFNQEAVKSRLGNNKFIDISAGSYHSLALTTDNKVIAWGAGNANIPNNDSLKAYKQSLVPEDLKNANVIAISAGGAHSLALKEDGTIRAWGYEYGNRLNVPVLAKDLKYTAISAGIHHSLALVSDGSIRAWGSNEFNQSTLPFKAEDNKDFMSIIAGGYHSIAIKYDGKIIIWGINDKGQLNIPSKLNIFNIKFLAAGYYYSLLFITTILKVSLNGSIIKYNGYWKNINIPDTINDVKIKYIGQNAFESTNITKITIPNSVLSIGDFAFSGATNLKEIIIDSLSSEMQVIGNNVFNNCSSLTKITIPNSVSSIGDFAFSGATNLKEIIIDGLASKIEVIGNNVFNNCSSLTKITIPNSVLSIGDFAFSGATNLKEIIIDGLASKIEVIGNNAFNNCSSLTKINIPNSIKIIGDFVFSGTTSLKEIIFNGSYPKFIYKNSFTNMSPDVKIYIPLKIEEKWRSFIDKNVPELNSNIVPDIIHSNCGYTYLMISLGDLKGITEIKLTETFNQDELYIKLPDSHNDIYSTKVFKYIDYDLLKYIKSPEILNIKLPRETTRIGKGAFKSSNLKKIFIPDTLEIIEESAFENTPLLKEITIPNKVNMGILTTNIFNNSGIENVYFKPNSIISMFSGYMFANTVNLKSIIIPDSVKSISAACFKNSNISDITFSPNSKLSYLGAGAFLNCQNLTNLIIYMNNGTIGSMAFKDATALMSLTLYNVSGIENDAFNNTPNLKKIYLNGTLLPQQTGALLAQQNKITPFAFRNIAIDLIIYSDNSDIVNQKYYRTYNDFPDYVKDKIPVEFFDPTGKNKPNSQNNQDSNILNIPQGTTSINNYQYRDNKTFTQVNIPNGVSSIGYYAFSNTELTTVSIPSSVNFIGTGAFATATKLKTVEIALNSNIQNIYENTFSDCFSLERITFPKNLKIIYNRAFAETKLSEIVLPSSLVEIQSAAFLNCSQLIKIKFNGEFPKMPIGYMDPFYGVDSKPTVFYYSYKSWNNYSNLKYFTDKGFKLSNMGPPPAKFENTIETFSNYYNIKILLIIILIILLLLSYILYVKNI